MIIPFASLENTESFASMCAKHTQTGDVFLLSGTLGTGKSSFARAFIRAYFCKPDLEVPSPTYTLFQTYDFDDIPPVHHLDLYRLSDEGELDELGLTYEDNITLIEWPERLSKDSWPDRFMHLTFQEERGLHRADIKTHNMGEYDLRYLTTT